MRRLYFNRQKNSGFKLFNIKKNGPHRRYKGEILININTRHIQKGECIYECTSVR